MCDNSLKVNMSALADKSIHDVRPLELALVGKGLNKISLQDVVAEIAKLAEEGYLKAENIANENGRFVLMKNPDDALPVYAQILLNGLFYKASEIPSINIPLIFSYAVQESLEWLQFENRKSLKNVRKEYQKHSSEFREGNDLYFLYVLGLDKKYAKNHPDADFSMFSNIYSCMTSVLTSDLTPIGRSSVGGLGRGIAGGAGTLSGNTDVKNIEDIDWNYLLYRK